MVSVTFKPSDIAFEVDKLPCKILLAARRADVDIRFGCASCRCGTCAVEVLAGSLSPMRTNEKQLLERMKLPLDGSVRLACQAKLTEGDALIDLSYQDKYSPDVGFEED